MLLLGASLSISPISVTQHLQVRQKYGYVNYPGRQEIARPFNAPTTYHPQLHIGVSWEYLQTNQGWTLDSEGKHAFHILVGPHYRFNNYFDVGFVIGPYLRKSHYPPAGKTIGKTRYFYSKDGFDSKEWELLPLYGLTVTSCLGMLCLESLLNHSLLNVGLSVKFN